jgi:hypothetical protein
MERKGMNRAGCDASWSLLARITRRWYRRMAGCGVLDAEPTDNWEWAIPSADPRPYAWTSKAVSSMQPAVSDTP